MQLTFLSVLLICIIYLNHTNGFYVEQTQTENNNNNNNNNKNENNTNNNNNYDISLSSLAEKLLKKNIQSAVLTSSNSGVQWTLPQDILPTVPVKTRLNKQEEEPVLITADRILKQITENKGGKYCGRSHYYRSNRDSISDTIVHAGYYADSYRVFSSEISFTKLNNGEVNIMDNLIVIAQPVDLSILINEEEARAIANILDAASPQIPNKDAVVELVVLPSCFNNNNVNCNTQHEGLNGTLTYLIEQPNNNIYFISAQTGEEMFSFNYEPNAFATTYYNGNVTINTYASPYGNYYMEDYTRNITTLNCNNGDCTATMKHIDSDNVWTDTNQKVANQVQWGVGQVLDYFKTVHNRNGLNNNNGPTTITGENGVNVLLGSKVHFNSSSNYFGWNGNELVFGDGDGTQYGPMVSLDIIAHEMAHAIIEYDCNLNYFGESGALAESFGDITAAAVTAWNAGGVTDAKTWKFGEDVVIGGAEDAIRYLNEPHLAKNRNFTFDDDPDHVSEMYNGTLDNGGVHVNCGIPNKVFYLLAKGGNHSNGGGIVMTGIGIEAAYAIWYRAVTVYFLSGTNFNDARGATQRAARDIYGTSNCFAYQSVSAAWGLCGVGAIPEPVINYLVNPGFEVNVLPWNLTGSGATYLKSTSEKKAGSGLLKFGINNGATGWASQNFSIPPNSVVANLSFWLWITTADSASVVNDRLYVEVKNITTGAIVATPAIYSNVDFTAAYVQKSFNFLPYMNRPGLALVFRVANDATNPTSFRVDECYLNVVTY